MQMLNKTRGTMAFLLSGWGKCIVHLLQTMMAIMVMSGWEEWPLRSRMDNVPDP